MRERFGLGRRQCLAFDRGRARVHVGDAGGPDLPVKQRAGGEIDDSHEGNAQHQVGGFHVAKEVNEHAAKAVQIEDVADPQDQVGVDQAEEDEPDHPPVKQPGHGPPGLLLLRHEQQDARPEDHAEQRPHLALEEHRDDGVQPEVDAGRIALEGLRKVVGHGEAGNVHQQNAQQGDATEGVDEPEPLCVGNGSCTSAGRASHR